MRTLLSLPTLVLITVPLGILVVALLSYGATTTRRGPTLLGALLALLTYAHCTCPQPVAPAPQCSECSQAEGQDGGACSASACQCVPDAGRCCCVLPPDGGVR